MEQGGKEIGSSRLRERPREIRSSRLPVLLFIFSALVACRHKGEPVVEAGAGDAGVDASVAVEDPRLDELWARARDGEADDLARLADREGSLGLEERAEAGAHRATALRAAAFAGTLEGLPWLASVAASGTDEEAEIALQSAAQLAAEPRRSVDPEDALEVRAGCDSLLALAKGADRPRARRLGAIRVLRMLADRGCAKADEIPSDLDVR
jgi:hypothetical protein